MDLIHAFLRLATRFQTFYTSFTHLLPMNEYRHCIYVYLTPGLQLTKRHPYVETMNMESIALTRLCYFDQRYEILSIS